MMIDLWQQRQILSPFNLCNQLKGQAQQAEFDCFLHNIDTIEIMLNDGPENKEALVGTLPDSGENRLKLIGTRDGLHTFNTRLVHYRQGLHSCQEKGPCT